MKETVVITSPLGNIRLVAADGFLLSCSFTEDPVTERINNLFFLDIISQLNRYFDGDLRIFDIPVAIGGSTFQKRFGWK